MILTRTIIERVQTDFRSEEQASALEYLSLYGSRTDEPHSEEVRLAILELAKGKLSGVIRYIEIAKRDYRQILDHPIQ